MFFFVHVHLLKTDLVKIMKVISCVFVHKADSVIFSSCHQQRPCNQKLALMLQQQQQQQRITQTMKYTKKNILLALRV